MDANKASAARAKAAAKVAAMEVADTEKVKAAFNDLYRDVQVDANKAAQVRARAAAQAAANEVADTEKVKAAFNNLYRDVQLDAYKAAQAREAASAKAAAKEIADAKKVEAATARSLDRIRRRSGRGFNSEAFFSGLRFPSSRLEAEAQNAAFRIRRSFRDLGSNIARSLAQGVKLGIAGIGLTGLAAGGGATFFSVQQAANLEQARVQFTNLAKNIDEFRTSLFGAEQVGEEFADSLVEISNRTTFSLQGLRDVTTALLAIGKSGEEARGIALLFADAAAAAGQSGSALDESVRGAVRAYSQIASKGKLAAQELNQIADQIPSVQRVELYENIAKSIQDIAAAGGGDAALQKFAKSLGTIDEKAGLSRKQLDLLRKQLESDAGIPTDIALPALEKTLAELEGASGALERQGDTLAGRLEALRDNLRTAFGRSFLESEAFQPLVDSLDPDKLQPQITAAASTFADAIGPSIAKVVPTLLENLPALSESIGKIFAGMAEAFVVILPIVTKVFEFVAKIFDAFKGEEGGQFFQDIAPLIEIVKRSFETFGRTLFVVGGIVGEVVHQLAPLFKVLGVVAKALGLVADVILAVFSNDIVQKITGFVLSFVVVAGVFAKLAKLAQSLTKATTFVGEFFSTLFGGGKIAQTVGGQVGKMLVPFGRFPKIFELISKAVGLLAKPLQLVAGLFSKLAGVMSKIPLVGGPISGLMNGIAKVLQLVASRVEFLAGALGALTGAFGSLLGKIPGVRSAMDAVGNVARKVGGFFGGLKNKITGAGNAAQAAAAKTKVYSKELEDINSQLAKLDGSTTEHDIIMRLQLIGAANVQFLKDNGIAPTGLEDATGFSSDFLTSGAFNKELQKQADAAKASVSSTGFGGGSSSKSGGGSSAKDKQSEIRDKVRAVLQGIKEELTTAESAKEVREAFAQMRKDIAEAFGKDSFKDVAGAKLRAKLQRQNKRLQKLVDERASIAKRLEAANEAFESTFESASGLGDIVSAFESIKDAANSAGEAVDLSRLRIIKPGQDAGLGGAIGGLATEVKSDTDRLQDALNERLRKLTEFNANIKKLIERGANRSIIKQLIEGGAESAGGLASQLAQSCDSSLKAISQAQKAIDDQAKVLAGLAADEAASIGENVSLGIVEGLKKRRKELATEIEKLVTNIIKTLRKQLGIKSPSKLVEDQVGQWIVPGITDRINADGHLVDRAINSMGNKLNKADLNLAPITTPELSALAERRASVELTHLTESRGTQASFDRGANAIVQAIREGGQVKNGRAIVEPTPAPVHSGTVARNSSGINFNAARIRGR